MARDGIKTPKDTNFIGGMLEHENHVGEKAKRKAHDVQMAGDCFRQPSKIASVETKKRLWKLLSKAQMVEATGFEPAESPGPKPGAIPSFATPRCIKLSHEIPVSGQICGQTVFYSRF